MINLVVIEPQETLETLAAKVKASTFGKQIFVHVLCKKNHAANAAWASFRGKNFAINVFDNTSSENQMLSAFLPCLAQSTLVLVRPTCKFFSAQNLDAAIEKVQSGADIAMFAQQKKRTKIGQFFAKTYAKLCRLFFGFEFFAGSTSLMAFSGRAHGMMRFARRATMTKLCKWVGMDVQYLPLPVGTKEGKNKLPISLVLRTIGAGALAAAVVAELVALAVIGGLAIWQFFALVALLAMTGCLLAHQLLQVATFAKIGEIHTGRSVDFVRREK